MILPTSKQRLIDHTVSLLEASHCIKVLITGKFAQAKKKTRYLRNEAFIWTRERGLLRGITGSKEQK